MWFFTYIECKLVKRQSIEYLAKTSFAFGVLTTRKSTEVIKLFFHLTPCFSSGKQTKYLLALAKFFQSIINLMIRLWSETQIISFELVNFGNILEYNSKPNLSVMFKTGF